GLTFQSSYTAGFGVGARAHSFKSIAYLIGSTRSSDGAARTAVSTSVRNVMPLKSRETSNLPESVGGRVALAEGAAVGVGEGTSISSARVIVQRQRSNEIQRSVIATKSAKKMRRTIRRSVPSPSFRTRLFPQPDR